MSLTVIFEVQLRPDAVEEGVAVVHRILADTRAFAGNTSVAVFQDREDPAHVVAIEVWESAEADAAYREWRAGAGKPTELAPLLTAPPRITFGTATEL